MKFELDIIIPAYKDAEGLRRTLNSAYQQDQSDWISITVVDDCSPESYAEVEKDFPTVQFYHLKENHGPGYARQYGMEHTSKPYFLFLDCGDIMLSHNAVIDIKNEIEKHPTYYIFLFTWIFEKSKGISTKHCRSTQGYVYKREFFKLFNVKFGTTPECSYAHEDVGFNRTCINIIKNLEWETHKRYQMYSPIVIQQKIFNESSITNACKYRLHKMIPGMAHNMALSLQELAENGVDLDILLDELCAIMLSLYKHFLRCRAEDITTVDKHWKVIRWFYLNTYKQYEEWPITNERLELQMPRNLKRFARYSTHANFRRFLHELNLYEECPDSYKQTFDII